MHISYVQSLEYFTLIILHELIVLSCEGIVCISVTLSGKTRFDIRVFRIMSMFLERIMLAIGGSTVQNSLRYVLVAVLLFHHIKLNSKEK